MTVSSDYWQGRRVLVTGVSGLVGSWLALDLLSKGAELTCLVRDKVSESIFYKSGAVRQCNLVKGSLEDILLAERMIAEYEPQTIFHLGGQTQVTIANKYPFSTFESNVRGTYSLLDAVRRQDDNINMVVASSDKAYGSCAILPYSEETPLNGINPYDASKSCVDLISRSYALTYGMNLTISRCGNFYGGGDMNFNRIVPSTIKSIVDGKKPVIRSDGKYIRDYIYVKDAVGAYLLLGEKSATIKPGEAFNFSTEDARTVLEIVNLIVKLMKSNLTPLIENTATGEIREQRLYAKKAREMLGWKAKYSLEDGLKETILWYERYFKEKKKAAGELLR